MGVKEYTMQCARVISDWCMDEDYKNGDSVPLAHVTWKGLYSLL